MFQGGTQDVARGVVLCEVGRESFESNKLRFYDAVGCVFRMV